MTRINAGIPVQELTGKHLIAEHREIKRIPNVIKSGRFNFEGQPQVFKLGEGHVKFFYDKLGYLLSRYKQLYNECLDRGYNVTDYSDAWKGIDDKYMNDYVPTPEAAELVRERINERLK